MTEIREPNFALDLPGEWTQAESAEPNVFLYAENDGPGRVSVTLLGVKPLFAIADQHRLLDDYLHHRSTFEKGSGGVVVQSPTVSREVDGVCEGSWSTLVVDSGLRMQHRVILTGGLLADVVYEAAGRDDAAFANRAIEILSAVGVTAPEQ